MEFQRRRKIDAGIDMTPMIDTLLQLFVTFLMSMTFAASAVRLELPKAAAGSTTPAVPIVISVDAAHRFFCNNEPIAPGELRSRLIASLGTSKEREVVLRADGALPYKDVLKALVEINHAGATNVHLAYEAERSQ
jgi:biopolymer transport protein ExbD